LVPAHSILEFWVAWGGGQTLVYVLRLHIVLAGQNLGALASERKDEERDENQENSGKENRTVERDP
jgi:hypothetical protein